MPEETPASQTQMVQDAWDGVFKGDPVSVTVPGAFEDIVFEKLTTESNRVSVWVSGSTSESPDFVIVNPPTEVAVTSSESESNPLGAIAVSIQGALNK